MSPGETKSRRERVLAQPVPPYPERRRQIESEPLPASIPALLAEAASEAPDRLAIDFFESGEQLTYAALAARVEALARGLAGGGVHRGTHVGVVLPNVAAFPVTWLALVRLGAVMVPMNVAYTPREMQYVIDNGDVDALVIHDTLLPALAALPARPARLADDRVFVVGAPQHGQRSWEALLHEGVGATGSGDVRRATHAAGGAVGYREPAASGDVPRAALAAGDADGPPPGLDDLANIQYTSGTTGFPKGCMLTHRYWLTIGKVNARRDGRRFERLLAATPFFYMDPQWLLMMAFYQRATLHVARRQSASRFMDWVREHRIHFTLFPEVAYKQPPSPRDRDNEIVRVNVYGLNPSYHAALEDRFDFVCREAFGMTEIGSGLFVPMEATETVGSGTCGIPVPFREARIVDESGAPVRTGEAGELQFRGPGMLVGYYGNPEATAAAFQDGWFRTGDVFRQDERGWYRIVGRLKDMIRRAGENIAAREVEAVLRALPEIAEAAVVGVPDEVRKEEVKAYVRLQPDVSREQMPPARILAHCAANLAPFKVPRYLAYVEDLPKTASGKIAKHEIVRGVADLRAGAWDRVEGLWR